MNVYDFDNTIYDGDSSVDFVLYNLRRHPSIVRRLPGMAAAGIAYKLGRITKTAMKERFFAFLADFPATDAELKEFWDVRMGCIKAFYLEQRSDDDVIVSASPEFLIAPACERLGICVPLGSRVDPTSGRFNGLNCHDAEKVARFRAVYPDARVEKFYSDSTSDAPLAALADQAFLVKGDRVDAWPA